MSEETLLQVNHLKKYYNLGKTGGGKKTLKAVDDVSLEIQKGQVFGLVGESGCGKSTLGRTILNLHSVTDGEVIFDGTHIENYSLKQMRPLRKEMQMIFQDPYASLNPRMTIYQSVKAPLDVLHFGTEKEKDERIRQMLEYVGVGEHHMEKYPHELSGGQRQRVVIARAMITEPRFVVCDEPVSALDVSVRAQVLNLMKKIQQDTKVAYLFISHDLSVVKYICDEIAVMYLGKIVELTDKKTLYENPLHPYTQALISAIPIPDIHVKKDRIILKGDIPNPCNPPQGCYFQGRCPYACEECSQKTPELRKVSEGHYVACHRVKE